MPGKKDNKVKKEKTREPEEHLPEDEQGDDRTGEHNPETEKEQHVPDDRSAFNELLSKFRIGMKGEFYKTITDDIATTGGEFVFERPDLLGKKLQEWHQYIDPPVRRQILEYWFTKKNIKVPQETLKEAGMDDDEKKKADEEKHHDEKFSVDPTTGVFKVADKSDVSPLSWGEADKLSKRIKNDLEDKSKRDKKDTDTGAKKTPFTIDGEGNVSVAAGTDLTATDLLVLQAINKSKEKGEQRSASQIIEEELKRADAIDELRGKSGHGGGLLDDMDRLIRVKDAFAPSKELVEVLAAINRKLDTAGEAGKTTPETEALRTQISELTRRLDDQDKQALRDQIAAQNAKIEALDATLKKQATQQTAANEFGIMSKAIDKIDSAGKDIKDTVLTIMAKSPPPMPAEEHAVLTEAIGAEAGRIIAKQELGKKIFIPPGK